MNKDHIIFLIGRISYKTSRFLTNELNARNIHGLSPSHGEIIGALIFKGKLQMKELIDLIHKDKSTITALVRKLIDLGYVEKTQDTDDRRINYIRLTAKGLALKPDIMGISKKLKQMAYKGITEAEKEVLFKLLGKLNTNI